MREKKSNPIYEYEKAHYWRVNLRVPIKHRESLEQAARDAGMSVNQYIVSAALDTIGAEYVPQDLIGRLKREKAARDSSAEK